jgi:NADH:ubiquinone oxidoreductase subunit 5 (subunit L)/multisubunit Na+/H+ antiporter MnhA subunit
VKEAPVAMLIPMIVIAGFCILFGVYNSLPLNGLIQPILGARLEGHNFAGLPHNIWLIVATVVVLILAYLNHLYGTTVLVTDQPVRGRLGGTDKDIPILSFVPVLDGVFDIQTTGTPAEQAAWLRSLAEQASGLAIQVERHAAQVAALATYPEAVSA